MLTDFPVFSLAFLQGEPHDRLVVGGGGGSTKSGIKNRLAVYKISSQDTKLQLEWHAEPGADAPMSLAAHPKLAEIVAGINCAESGQDPVSNGNLRRFKIKDIAIDQEGEVNATGSADMREYPRSCAFAPDGHFVICGSTNGNVDLFSYPDLQPQRWFEEWIKEEVYDVDMNAQFVLVVGSARSCVWAISQLSSAATASRLPLQTIEKPEVQDVETCTFRAGRFGRQSTAGSMYTVVNTVGKRPARLRKSFLSVWNTETWQLSKSRPIAKKAVTAFDMAADGSLIAYASADLQTGILDAQTLQLLFTIPQSHSFPATCVKFDPRSTLVVTGSADSSLQITELKSLRSKSGGRYSTILLLVAAILAIIAVACSANPRLLWMLTEHVHL